MSERLINFLRNEGPNSKGLYLEDILDFSCRELELNHEYIQWCFPLREKSEHVPNAPILTDEDIDAIKNDPVALENIDLVAEKMYGFYCQHPVMSSRNHNSLRITRILNCLHLFESKMYDIFFEMAMGFYESSIERNRAFNRINETTFNYWLKSQEYR